jgi:hypothetical protein
VRVSLRETTKACEELVESGELEGGYRVMADGRLERVYRRAGLLLDDGGRGLAGRVEVTFARGPDRATEIIVEDLSDGRRADRTIGYHGAEGYRFPTV